MTTSAADSQRLQELTQTYVKNHKELMIAPPGGSTISVNKENVSQQHDQKSIWNEFGINISNEMFPTNQSSRVNLPGGPHYEIPNLSSMLYEFTNREVERIQQGFRVGNFVSLRDLPADLNYGNVLNAQKEKIEQNIVTKAEPKTYVELLQGGGYFSKFDWKPDPYGLFLETQNAEKEERKLKQEFLHGQNPFVSMSQIPVQLKHVSNFDASCGSGQMASFLFADDPYDNTKLEVMKSRWFEDSKILYGTFRPAHFDQALKSVNRQHLPEVIGFIKRSLLADWSDISFVIGTNPEDFIEMRFDIESLDSPQGLQTYLNNMVNCNDFVLKYQLRRIVQFWNHYSDNGKHVYFMLAPPWVKLRRPVLYLKQIQEMRDQQEAQNQKRLEEEEAQAEEDQYDDQEEDYNENGQEDEAQNADL